MGDYVLMKTLLFTFIFVTGTLFANANTEWVDKQIEAIKPPRSGVSHASINQIKNPFVYTYATQSAKASSGVSQTTAGKAGTKTATQTVAQTAPLKLSAVMNNSALISGTWYQANDKVHGYTLAKIEEDSVLLTTSKTKKMLFITEENPNIKIQVK